MKNNINFIHFQTFILLMHYMQTLKVVFRLDDFFIPVVNLQLENKRDGALGLYPFSEGPCYFILTASFLSYLFLYSFYLGHVINMADAAVFEISFFFFLSIKGQINTYMSMRGFPFNDPYYPATTIRQLWTNIHIQNSFF